MDKPRIAFLCGAGTSVAAGMPTTKEITDELLSKKNINETIISDPSDFETVNGNLKPLIWELLNKLKLIADEYNTSQYWEIDYSTQLYSDKKSFIHTVNYEDLYFMLSQMHKYLVQDFNPYGKMLCEKTCFQWIYSNWTPHNEVECEYSNFIDYTVLLIEQTIVRTLKTHSYNLDNLNTIVEAYKDASFTKKALFTLNHDFVLEELMAKNGICFIDGFGKKNGDLRIWNPTLFDSNSKKVRLLKLHGSIDRRRLLNKDKEAVDAIYIGNGDLDKPGTTVQDAEGNIYTIPFYPHILVGTDNKTEEYISSIFWEQLFRFRKYLADTDYLITCGYSFGDSPINRQILEWMDSSIYRKMVVIDTKDENSFVNCSKYEFRYLGIVMKLLEKGRIVYLRKNLEDTTWDEIKSKINS